MKDRDFRFMDFAPDFDYYTSDLTRMRPVDGNFSPTQGELYEFYVGYYRAILKAIKPGITVQAILQTAVREMDGILAKQTLRNYCVMVPPRPSSKHFASQPKTPRLLSVIGSACRHTMWVRTTAHSGQEWHLLSSRFPGPRRADQHLL
jgi:hypothetical protein